MEEIRNVVKEITNRTFNILRSVYLERKEDQDSNAKDLGTRIIFPNYSDGGTRLSEQELRFVFVEQFNKYCKENHLHYYYSVETPTEHKYLFADKEEPKRDPEKGQSAMVDLAIHDENLKRVALIEFKALNPDEFCFKKDFCKLREEVTGKDQLSTFFIMFVKSANERTKQSILKKIRSKPNDTVFRCFNLSEGVDLF